MECTMKKLLLALAAIFAASTLSAQSYKESGTSPQDVVLFDYAPYDVTEGDLNKDGKKDFVITAPSAWSDDRLAIFFGDGKGTYTLFRSYELRVPEKDGVSITDKGVLRLQFPVNGGSDVFLYRFQQGDFYLIGGKKDRHATDHYDESYNYLTHKMIRTDGEGKGKTSDTLYMPDMPELPLGWMPLDYNMLDYLLEGEIEDGDLVEFKTAMGIFRLMQAQDMLFWTFCEYERNSYLSWWKDAWHESDYCEFPAKYNQDSSLTIQKQEDGSYLIRLEERMEDRSYEAEINEDGSNIDEVLENAEPEIDHTISFFTFQDGQFIPGETIQVTEE